MATNGEKTTIIFVSKDQNLRKPIQVPTKFIKHRWVYFYGIVGLAVMMSATIFYLSYSKLKLEESHSLTLKTLSLVNQKLSKYDTTSVNKQYEAINQKIAVINRLLKSKGVKTNNVAPKDAGGLGGEGGFELLNTKESGEFYNGYLDNFIFRLSHTPLGKPNVGKITSGFGYRENPFTGENIETHKGLDIKAEYGSIVKSTANGVVTFTGNRGGFGNLIVINHGNGFQTFFGHLSKILVKQGQIIKAGYAIGRVGSTGRSTGPHLHYEIHKNGKVVNPKSFLTL